MRSIQELSSAPTFLEPGLRLSAYPTCSCEMGLESINQFNCAIGPFSFDNPVLAVPEHHTEDRSSCCYSDHHRYLPRRLHGCRYYRRRKRARSVGGRYSASRLRLTLSERCRKHCSTSWRRYLLGPTKIWMASLLALLVLNGTSVALTSTLFNAVTSAVASPLYGG